MVLFTLIQLDDAKNGCLKKYYDGNNHKLENVRDVVTFR